MTIFTRTLSSLLISGLFLTFTTTALAARSYLVELAIFTTQDSGESEKWFSSEPPLNSRKMSRGVFPGAGQLELNQEPSELKESNFSSYVNRIRNNPRRRVILSTHWVQPVSSPGNTTIALISDRKYSAPIAEEGNLNNSPAIKEQPLINGFINFYLDGQYTLEADIRYTPPYRPSILDEEPDSGPLSFRIYEKRRMKSGELNYYDHPKFGMLLLVTPVDSPL